MDGVPQDSVELILRELVWEVPPGRWTVYRFLAALQHEGVAGALGWDWGVLSNAPSINQSNTTLGGFGVGITITTWGGQTFTPSATGQLVKADINLFCSGCTGTTPDLTLSLRATSGGLP